MDKGPSAPGPTTAPVVKRTRNGCLTCRRRRVKCDEVKPICEACQRLSKQCHWQDQEGPLRRMSHRRPNATACRACRGRKLKCEGDPSYGTCSRCLANGIQCEWGEGDDRTPVSQRRLVRSSHSPSQPSSSTTHPSPHHSRIHTEISTTLADTEALVDRYFEVVHHFGFFTFIHQLRFKRLLQKGQAPRDLTRAMVANVLRFACDPTPSNISRSDSLINSLVASMMPQVLQGFGVIQLMALLLVCQVETCRDNYSSSWLLTGNCARMMQMMSLHVFDRTFPDDISETPLSPLLSAESLRRVAWSVFYLDSLVDGGRDGYNMVDVNSFRVQLPSNEACFLGNDNVRTEPLIPEPGRDKSEVIGISGYLVRAAWLRRRVLYIAFRISHGEGNIPDVQAELDHMERDINWFISSLPPRYHFSPDNCILHRKRLPAFIVLHLLRHNLYVILGRAKLLFYKRDPIFENMIPGVRRQRISYALPVAGIVEEGLRMGTPFDPHAGFHAYVALEILLFEPRRIAVTDPNEDPKSDRYVKAIPPLLALIRDLGRRSIRIHYLHAEAVHRLLRCEFFYLLSSYDLEVFSAEYQPVGQDEAEFDFRDFRGAKLERLRRDPRQQMPTAPIGDAALLEFPSDPQPLTLEAANSPRVAAQDTNSTTQQDRQPATRHGTPPERYERRERPVGAGPPGALDHLHRRLEPSESATHPWIPLFDPNPDQGGTLDLSWLWDESGAGLQTGDPADFWGQIGQ